MNLDKYTYLCNTVKLSYIVYWKYWMGDTNQGLQEEVTEYVYFCSTAGMWHLLFTNVLNV